MACRILRTFHHCRKTNHSRHCIKGRLRTLLTEAYRCDQTWEDRLKSPELSQVNLNEFSIQVLEKLDRYKKISLVDMEILANKVQEMDSTEDEEIIDSIITKFNRSIHAFPVKDSVHHALIRGYMQLGKIDTLISMMKDKLKYGMLPDPQVACILMDYLLKKEDYANAAKVAYEMALQEDFSHPTSYLLTLFACVKRYYTTEELERWEPAVIEPDEEVQYVRVGFIRVPFYDDHFDIKNERWLLGKSMYSVGKELDNVVGRSLQLIGLGLYDKFPKANGLLEKWTTEMGEGAVITEDALKRYSEYLSEAPTRDPDTPEKEQGDRTMDDEIMKLRLTPQEKEDCLASFEKLHKSLNDSNRLSTENIEEHVEQYVKSEIPKYEAADIEILNSNYKKWNETRSESLKIQMREYLVKQKESEIQEKFKKLQEKEQLLTFFEKENELALAGAKIKDVDIQEKQEQHEYYVEAPGERESGKKMKKKAK